MSDPNVGQGQYDPNAAGGTQDPNAAQGGQNTGMGADQINAAKQQTEQQVDNTIGQFASKVPGGDQFAQQAEQQANSAIDNLAQQGQQQTGNLEQQAQQGGLGGAAEKLGGMFGGDRGGNQ